MDAMEQPDEVPYPPPPWRLRGQAWVGLFRTNAPVGLPDGLCPVLGARSVVVALVRYTEGTLRYDELVVGQPALLAGRAGLYVRDMWVDDPASLWGGRRLWGVPKRLAAFDWREHEVRVADAEGHILTAGIGAGESRLPPVWLPAPFFGTRDGTWLFTAAWLWARPRRTDLRLDAAPDRFPFRLGERPLLRTAASFAFTVPRPRVLRP